MSPRTMTFAQAREITDVAVECADKALRWKARMLAAESTLMNIAHFDCYTRDGEELPHLVMMRIAAQTLAQNEIGGLDAKATGPEHIARLFHEAYERLAPQHGYETREDTKAFDPASANGKLMIATVRDVLARLSPSPLQEQSA